MSTAEKDNFSLLPLPDAQVPARILARSPGEGCPGCEGTCGKIYSQILAVPEPSPCSDRWQLRVSLIRTVNSAYPFWVVAQSFHVCEEFPLGFIPSFLC